MIPETEINVNGRTIHGAARGRTTGLFIEPNGFTGWDDSPVVVPDDEDMVNGGQFDLEGHYSARLMTVQFNAVASDEYELGKLRSWFTPLSRGAYLFNVLHQGEKLEARGRAQSTAQFRDTGYRNGFAYASCLLPVKFPDFRKYGEMQTESGTSIVAFHRGNYPADPVVEVTGNMPLGYSITGAGKTIVVTQALPPGTTHRIDFRTKRLYRNGVWQPGALNGPTWQVPDGPAGVAMALIPASGTGSMKVNTPDTHI